MNINSFETLQKHVIKMMLGLRNEHHYSQEYVAAEIGINQNTYSKIESGQTGITLKRLWQASIIYNRPLTDFVDITKNIPDFSTHKQRIHDKGRTTQVINENRGFGSRAITAVEHYHENAALPELLKINYEQIDLEAKIKSPDDIIKLSQDLASIIIELQPDVYDITARKLLSEIAMFNMLTIRLNTVVSRLLHRCDE